MSDGREFTRPTGTPNIDTADHKRRSTRVLRSVLLNISGQNRVGNPISELTSAVSVSFHGCLYSSRYDHRPGSWVTVEVVNEQTKGKLQPMRAQVKYIGLPRSTRDLYRVGVELETPANIWGVKSPPQDWHPSSANAVVATRATALPPAGAISSGTIAVALEGSTEAGQPVRVSVSADQILSALAIKLQQEAEKAMALAVTHRLEPAVTAAVKSIEDAAQMRLRTIEERVPPHDGILGRLKAILAKLRGRLQKQDGVSLAEVQETVLHFESGAPETKSLGANMLARSERLAAGEIEVRAGGEVHYQVNVDTSKMIDAKIVGSFRVSGGTQNDIAAALVVEGEFENWISGRQANVLFATNKVTRARLNWPITSSGTYLLAFDNRFSLLSPKRIAAEIELRYCVQK